MAWRWFTACGITMQQTCVPAIVATTARLTWKVCSTKPSARAVRDTSGMLDRTTTGSGGAASVTAKRACEHVMSCSSEHIEAGLQASVRTSCIVHN